MKEILKRLDEINKDLKTLEKGEGDTYTILRNRRRAERDGIVFALKCLGLTPTNNPYEGWSVYADGKDNQE
jgi:hypothetical protein